MEGFDLRRGFRVDEEAAREKSVRTEEHRHTVSIGEDIM